MRQVFIHNLTSHTATGSVADLAKGEVGIFNAETGARLDLSGANASAKMFIAQGTSAGFPQKVSGVFNSTDVKVVKEKLYVAPARQQTTVGFNGDTANELKRDTTNGGEYILKFKNVGQGGQPHKVYTLTYKASPSDGEYTIARALQLEAVNSARKGGFPLGVEVLVEESTTQLVDNNGSPANVTAAAVNGEKNITCTVTSGQEIDGLSVGDLLRIGHATDDAYPVYVVEAIGTASGTTQVVTLDRPYQGPTASGLALGNTSTQPAAADDAGLLITGGIPSQATDDPVDGEPPVIWSFLTTLDEPSLTENTPILSKTAPVPGSGTYEQVALLEDESQAAEGFLDRATPFEGQIPEKVADPTLNYDINTILVLTNTTPNIAKSNKYQELVIAIEAGTETDLNTFFGV